jgi:hypothetical protein
MTPAKPTLFDKVFQHHEQQLLQEVGTKATGHRSILPKQHALLKAAAEDEASAVAHLTADKRLQFQFCLSNAWTEAMT